MIWNLTPKRPGGAAHLVDRLAFIRSLQTTRKNFLGNSPGYNNDDKDDVDEDDVDEDNVDDDDDDDDDTRLSV